MTADGPGPFPAEALEANRAGGLTDAQRQTYTVEHRFGGGHDLYVAAFFVLVAVVVFRANGPAASAWLRTLAAGGALVMAAVLVLRPRSLARRRIDRDLKAGRVESLEGAIAKYDFYGAGSSGHFRHYRLEVAGRTFRVSRQTYEATPNAGYVRLYFLPASGVVVNLEHLPDRPLPREALADPREALRTLGTAIGLHGREAAAEARAGLQGLANTLMPQRALDATPPPLSARDPRPLEHAILGRWRSGAMNVAFSGDGTVTVTGFAGMERRGRWSVDGAGRLRSDATGHDAAADAWIAGDALTISAPDGALVFHRA